MLPLYRYFNRTLQEGDVGLEIESEYKVGGRLPNLNLIPAGWSWKPDGSLRNEGREFVAKKPFTMSELGTKVKRICEYIKHPDYDLIPENNRCGVHVHVNVGNLDILEYYTAATAYWLLENLMLKYCGEDDREGNAYCLRIADAESVLDDVIRNAKKNYPLRNADDLSRYASQNLSCTYRYCSIEYRGMRGTYDPEVITEWAKALWTLSRKAKDWAKNPEDFFCRYYAAVSSGDADNVLKDLFPESFVEKLKAIPDYQELMKDNLDRVDSLAYMHDWDKWHKRLMERVNPGTSPTTTTIRMGDWTVAPPQPNIFISNDSGF